DGNDGDYVVTYVSPKIDATFKLVYQGIGGDDEKPKVNIRLTRNGLAFGDVVTVNGEYEYIFKGIDKTDEKEKLYKYGVEVVGEVTGYDATISADGNTVILTKKIEKGKILPYAGPKTNILFGIALIVIIGYAVKVFNNQRRMNNIKKIKGIKR
ncbi:MAG: Cna B-type domain-containing protein, partial [Clostridiales bacterium]|nr:Cna B-type domain-containing protein [Clostridiales bacterium]